MLAENEIDKRNDSVYRLELVKYHPSGYNSEGVYIEDDWTSVSDIGTEYSGERLLFENYISVEDCFVRTVGEIMLQSGCHYMTLYRFDHFSIEIPRCYDNNIKKSSRQLLQSIGHVKSGKKYAMSSVLNLFRLSLRELIDCCFINYSHDLFFMVSWDYYIHVYSRLDYHEISRIAQNNNLYINPRSYIDFSHFKYEELKNWLSLGSCMTLSVRKCLAFEARNCASLVEDALSLLYLASRVNHFEKRHSRIYLFIPTLVNLEDAACPISVFLNQNREKIVIDETALAKGQHPIILKKMNQVSELSSFDAFLSDSSLIIRLRE